ncbi:uncharacterized protein Z520_04014 [Fonsecaea multimorphosa CBS 102226]|uniref:SET domain-containing protein n=1 Tax=Fonsecaea multimorphosa CBS 102226 TaxID=1442371 RepID=A0A0D2KUA6_9EURO|nr:uncharacterized protein Z520_04014 [Fonsecaea multimorphosa CBS 102226]KIY00329.1 hypothetical protein Z520_04014 [Fonsecaea multimorphosa CBS 102226]OAL27161.1 hypothetical protein AYO22_03792 [Fonsecaea multimorphosa]
MEPDETTLDQDAIDKIPQSSTPPLRMNVEGAAAADVFRNHRRLVDWVLENDGYMHPHAQIAFSSRNGYHAVVADGHSLVSGTRVASCPMTITLSVLNAFNIDPFSNHDTCFPTPFLYSQSKKPESLQAFFLMEQLILGEKSWWAPYIATLPTVEDITAMQFEEEADAMWLEGTNLKGGLSTQAAKWEDMYSQGSAHLRKLGWPSALNGSYTWPRFRWAATIFGSRSFTSQVLDATLPADLATIHRRQEPYDLVKLFGDRFAVLLPLLDLLNHKPAAQVEWQAQYHFVGLQILEAYESGQELYNNYGPRDNEGLLLAYGFTIQHNPFDHLVVSIKAPPGSPLDVARRLWKQDIRSDIERRCFIFNHKHPESTSALALESSLFSFDLLDSISILCANDREMQSMTMRNQSLMSFCLADEPRFQDRRIILATLGQLLRECIARSERLRNTDPRKTIPGLEPANSKQSNAKVYRESQLEIVETAVALCNFVLRCAIGGSADAEQILTGMQGQVSSSALANLRLLTRRHVRLTRPFELLSLDGLVEMVPNSESVRKCLVNLSQQLQSNADGTGSIDASSPTNFSKGRLAVALSALYSEYAHGVKLPHRVTEWVKQLVTWYPPDSDSWAYVPTPGPWTPGEEPPAELMDLLAARAALSPTIAVDSTVKRWLRPERICWGWNVMEEEKVTLPSYLVEEESNGVTDGISHLIYWQLY